MWRSDYIGFYEEIKDAKTFSCLRHTYNNRKKQKKSNLSTRALKPNSLLIRSILIINCGSICEHDLFLQYNTITKKFEYFQILVFLYFTKIKSFWTQIWVILHIYKPSLGSCEVPHKIWVRSIQPFWRLLNTNKQTNKQTDKQWIDRQRKRLENWETNFTKIQSFSYIFGSLQLLLCFLLYQIKKSM